MNSEAGLAGHVLVVDDLPSAVTLCQRLLSDAGFRVSVASNGHGALQQVAREAPDLILMDVQMPEMDGLQACAALKRNPSSRLIPVVLVTGLHDLPSRINGIEAGADDFLTKPFNTQELVARARSLVRLKRFTDELESAEAMILTLALTIEARDPYTDGHCHRLSAYATALGEHLGLSAVDLAALHRGGFLHDVGKVGIPDAILGKPSRLTPEEFERMKQHTVIGSRLCGELRSLQAVKPIVRSHHERLDGSGYPDGLSGDEIPRLAQIMSVVDVYDALTTKRPYRPAMAPDEALATLQEEAARGWWRPELVEALAHLRHEGRLAPAAQAAVAR